LTWNSVVSSFDGGKFSCVVRQNESGFTEVQSMTVIVGSQSNVPPYECSLEENGTTINIRIRLGTECKNFLGLKLDDFAVALVSAANGICNKSCTFTGNSITVLDRPTCPSVIGAIFSARISAPTATRAREIFCALEEWKLRGGVIVVYDKPYVVDQSFALLYESLTVPLESGGTSSAATVFIILAVPIFAAMFIVLILIVKRILSLRSKKSSNVGSSLTQRYEA